MSHKKRVVLTPASSSYGLGVAKGVAKYAAECGGWDFLYKSDVSDPHVMMKAAAAAAEWADGVIGHFLLPSFMQSIIRTKIPAVNVSDFFGTKNPVRVHTDNIAVGRMVARHFLERGVRQFCYWGFANCLYTTLRHKGFSDTVAEAGYTCDFFDSGRGAETQAAWIKAQKNLASRIQKMPKPVGIMCVNDLVAREALWVCRRVGLLLPEDAAIVGVNNDEATCTSCIPTLSSVDLGATRIGYDAGKVLDGMMNGGKRPDAPILCQPLGVVVRQSSDVMSADNQDVSDALRFIREHVSEPIDVRDILRAVPISRRALEINFQRLLSRSPREQIFHERIERVKRILVETDLSISSIAERSGFSSPSVFWDVFKRLVGQGPKDFRALHR